MTTITCNYFGQCGGCSCFAMSDDAYLAYKQKIIMQMIHRLGVDDDVVKPLLRVPVASRRRVQLQVQSVKGEVQLGYCAPKSHEVVDIDHCAVMHPALNSVLPILRTSLAGLRKPSRIAQISITVLFSGLDITFIPKSPLSLIEKQTLADAIKPHANTLNITRVSEQREIGHYSVMAQWSPSTLRLGEMDVDIPPMAFLQASEDAQIIINTIISDHIYGHTIIDLYAGCGTYGFTLAMRGYKITAYEGNADMVMAAQNAIRSHHREDDIQFFTQDLFSHPVATTELSCFDTAIINPPRNGASPQIKELANSAVKCIIMISCNPATCERDARILLKAGWSVDYAVAIDQFVLTKHLEIVIVFHKT